MLNGSLLGHPALPLMLGRTGSSVQQSLDNALLVFFGKDAPRGELLGSLLEGGYIVPLVDRLSERDVAFQQSVEAWAPLVGLMVTTTRSVINMAGDTLILQPMPICAVSVLSRYIEYEMEKQRRAGAAHPMSDTASIINVLVHTIACRPDPAGNATTQHITPLLASTFTSLALEILQDGGSLERLPRSTSQVYLTYLRRMTESAIASVPSAKIVLACCELGNQAVRHGNGPRPIALETAVPALEQILGEGKAEVFLLHLLNTGIVRKLDRVGGNAVVFVIDSFAEVLAANFMLVNSTEGPHLEQALRQRVQGVAAPSLSVLQTLEYLEEQRAFRLASQP